MDERKIKRLLVMLVMAIIIIMIAKYLLTTAVTNLGNAALEKQRAGVVQPTRPPSTDAPSAIEPEPPAASAVVDEGTAASAVEPTAQ